MRYQSTRGRAPAVDSVEATLTGLATDGGLYVNDDFATKALDVQEITGGNYMMTAFAVLSRYFDDFTETEIQDSIKAAYTQTFDTPQITPVTEIGPDYLLELYHGPTSAFKDLALCLLPQLLKRAAQKSGTRLMIVTATSGDTGKAALNGFQDVPGIGITVFYPEGKVSDIQRLQMVTQTGRNVTVAAVRGNFDDIQTEVKRIFEREKGSHADNGIQLSSANSINIARLIAQVSYYYEAYRQLLEGGKISRGTRVDFCVPTGNFGDVLAGYYAKRMGLPVGRLIVASNANKVLTDFFETGLYDKRRNFIKSISPSMDILVSSNLERLLFHASNGDAALVGQLMASLSQSGFYRVPDSLLEVIRADFAYGFADDDATKRAIAEAWTRRHRLIDPHTAVAYAVAQKNKGENPMVIVSTASPFKFSKDVLLAIDPKVEASGLTGFDFMDRLATLSSLAAPKALSALREMPVLHPAVIDVKAMQTFVNDASQKDF